MSGRAERARKKKNKWGKNKNLYSLYKKAYTPWNWYNKLNQECKKRKLVFFPSVFDKSSVDYALKGGTKILKIASPEINDIDLLEYISKKKIPYVMISTGLANEKEIKWYFREINDRRIKNVRRKKIFLKTYLCE